MTVPASDHLLTGAIHNLSFPQACAEELLHEVQSFAWSL